MQNTTHLITGAQLQDCNTWYDVYQKLSQPPHSISTERLERLKQHCTKLHCTGCMYGKVVEVVDTKNKVSIKLSDYNNQPSMRTINEWNIKGYQRFCHNCKKDYDHLNAMHKNIKSLEQKEIPEKWTEAQPFSNSHNNTLLRQIPVKTIISFEPEIKNGMYENPLINGRFDFSSHRLDDESSWSWTVSAVRNALSWPLSLFYGTATEQRQPGTCDLYITKPGYFLNFKNTSLQHLPSCFKDIIDFRGIITRHFRMFALVDKSWTSQLADKIKEYNIHSCLEIGAGNGYLCKALNEHGIAVTATDKKVNENKTVTTVTELDATEAIRRHPETDALIISWPYENAGKMIANWPVGKWVIYIGEHSDEHSGCNAKEDFFNQVDFESYSEIPIPRWKESFDICLIGKKVKDWERPEWCETGSDSEEG